MVQQIDLSQAQYLDELPDGAEVGMACRTVGGEWFFLKSKFDLFSSLMKDPRITQIWWPGKIPVSVLEKSNLTAVVSNSLAVLPLVVERNGVPVYTARYVNLGNLAFQAIQHDQTSIERSEIAVFYIGSDSRISNNSSYNNYCSAGANYQGFRVVYAGDSYSDWRIIVGNYIHNKGPIDASLGINDVQDGFLFLHSVTSYVGDQLTLSVKAYGYEAESNAINSIKGFKTMTVSATENRLSSGINNNAKSECYAGNDLYPVLYIKAREIITDIEFNKFVSDFKSEYGI
ncbi:MAG: hypothetical protein LRY66_06070 [Saccharospirillaceae bacterium]|nr:hypothetical protein [Saccharospirillaceae bacterium]MCD8530922.1 hypothetical protein [Saccharospirillaceae bacterium]